MRLRILCSAGLLTLLCACSSQHQAPDGKLAVAASFYPLAFLAQQIGGDQVHVLQVTPGGVEPHDFEPTSRQLVAIHQSKVFLMNGGGIDAWGDKIIADLNKDGVMTVRMFDTITPLNGFSEEGFTDPTQPSSEATNVADPHIWLDPHSMLIEAGIVEEAFIKADPAHADLYKKNGDMLTVKLDQLDQKYRTGLSHCGLDTVVVSHNAFRYMAKSYGFTTLAISGLSPDQEPSAKRVAELSTFAKQHNIKYIFFEALVSPKISETVANEIGAQTLVLDPIEGLTPDEEQKGVTYMDIMEQNLTNLRTALQCQ